MKAWRTDVFTCLEGVRDDNLIVCVVVRGCSGTDKWLMGGERRTDSGTRAKCSDRTRRRGRLISRLQHRQWDV